MNNTVTYFDRHANMDSATRELILKTIDNLKLCPLGSSVSNMENWLYGAFDGYNYSSIAMYSKELENIKKVDTELWAHIAEIFGTIARYPKIETNI